VVGACTTEDDPGKGVLPANSSFFLESSYPPSYLLARHSEHERLGHPSEPWAQFLGQHSLPVAYLRPKFLCRTWVQPLREFIFPRISLTGLEAYPEVVDGEHRAGQNWWVTPGRGQLPLSLLLIARVSAAFPVHEPDWSARKEFLKFCIFSLSPCFSKLLALFS
jgi:hypothetical protein